MKTKRFLSALVTVSLLLTVLASLPFTAAAEGVAKTISKTNPVITANVGDEVDLSLFSVVTDGSATLNAKDITWTWTARPSKRLRLPKRVFSP